MRFPIRLFVFAAAPILLASAAQVSHGGRAAPQAAGRIVSSTGGQPYHVPPSVSLQHPELRPHAAGFTGIRPGAYSSSGGYYYQGGRRGKYGYGGYLPYTYAVPYVPIFNYGDYGDSQQANAVADAVAAQAQTAATTQNLLGEQVQRLSAEVENLRNQAATQPAPEPSSPAQPQPATPQAQAAPDPLPPQPPITVVLKNGNRVQVQNYAVMGQTFWDFSTQPARKIPLSSINVPESINASNANGAEFPSLTASR
jgi:hypothetical protein